jgi:hypothetical protein
MATIACRVAHCRHNATGVCGLTTIEVIPRAVTPDTPDTDTAQIPEFEAAAAGYGAEFESYLAYALSVSQRTEPAAVCASFSPQ